MAQALHEILQNARRSGATSVAITRDLANRRITVSDDGRGIGDPRTLLAFGRSGWPKDLHGAEHPAGMGIFSLARRSPRIRSRVAGRAAWGVELAEDHFVGRAPAAVAADPDWARDHGTDVTFSVLPTDTCWTPGVIADALRHYPIPVSVNGRRPEQSDFLKDAVRTETWRGLRVGVFHSASPTWATPSINFHGLHVAFPDLPQVHALPGADADAPRTWWTLADVVDCPDLELTLPTRTAIVQTPFTAELVRRGDADHLPRDRRRGPSAAARLRDSDESGRGRHRTPGRPSPPHAVAAQQRARREAPRAPAAPGPPARHPGGRRRAGRRGVSDARLGGEGVRHARPVLGDRERASGLPVVRRAPVHHRRQRAHEERTQTHTSTRKTRRDGESPFRGAVDEIELELLVKRAGRDARIEVRIPTSAALLSPEGGGTSEPEPVFVTRRDAPIDRGALGNALAEAYFQPSFDCDADSVDTQMREYRRRIAYIVTELLESREAAADADLRELVTTCILPSMSGDSNIDIEIRNGALTAIHRI